jgi:hypothetical protein
MTDFKTYQSQFHTNVTIFIVYEQYLKYPEIKKLFNKYGYAFVVPEKNTVIVDGEIIKKPENKYLLHLIEAHEVSHIILGHKGINHKKEELEADTLSYHFLSENNYKNSLNLLLNTFESRHGKKFSEKKLSTLKKSLGLV